MKNSDELLKRNEEMVLPLFCMTFGHMNKVQIMKDSLFTSDKNSFEIMAAKFVPYFEGGKIRMTRKIKI